MDGNFRSKVYLTLNLDEPEQFTVGARTPLVVDRLQIVTDIRDGLPRVVHVWGTWDMPERAAQGCQPSRGDMVTTADILPAAVREHFDEAFRNWCRTVFQAWAQPTCPARSAS